MSSPGHSQTSCLLIDETLRLAQQLLKLLQRFQSDAPVSSSSASPDIFSGATHHNSQPNMSSSLLILSSYTRLTAIASRIFESIQFILESDCSSSMVSSPHGSLSPTSNGLLSEMQMTPRLRATLIIDAMELMLRDISGLVGLNLGTGTETGTTGARNANIPAAICEILCSQIASLEAEQTVIFKQIQDVRRRIMHSPYDKK